MPHDLSPVAQAVVDELADDDEHVMALPIPYGLPARERAVLLEHHGALVEELRAAGWTVTTRVGRAPNGEVLALELERPAHDRRPAGTTDTKEP